MKSVISHCVGFTFIVVSTFLLILCEIGTQTHAHQEFKNNDSHSNCSAEELAMYMPPDTISDETRPSCEVIQTNRRRTGKIIDTSTESPEQNDASIAVHNAGPAEIMITVTYALNNQNVTQNAKVKANKAKKFTVPNKAKLTKVTIAEYETTSSVSRVGRKATPHKKDVLKKDFASPKSECYRTYGRKSEIKYSVVPCASITSYTE